MNNAHSHHPRTALITGASTGIGEEYARQLAKRGYALVLVARRAEALDALAAELSTTYGVTAHDLPADLGTEKGIATVEERLRADGDGAEAPVDILVNNAGMGLGGAFSRQDVAEIERLLDLNVRAVVRLTHAVLSPQIVRRKEMGERGGVLGVINVSSLTALLPGVPGGAMYGASKAFVTSFSAGVGAECGRHGVQVTAVNSGYVRTEMTSGLQEKGILPDALWVDKERVVAESLRAFAAGRVEVVPSPVYRGLAGLVQVAPKTLLRRALRASGLM